MVLAEAVDQIQADRSGAAIKIKHLLSGQQASRLVNSVVKQLGSGGTDLKKRIGRDQKTRCPKHTLELGPAEQKTQWTAQNGIATAGRGAQP